MALLAILGSAAVMIGNNGSDAAIGGYGEVQDMGLSFGSSYTSPTYPADLDVTISTLSNDYGGTNPLVTGDYGEIYEVDLAPGFSYIYTPTFPADLDVTISILECDEEGIDVSIEESVVKVTVKDGVTSGTYDLVLKAETNTGGLFQDAYQQIRFNVVSGLVIEPGQAINDIIKGASVNFTPQASSGMDTVTWSVKGELPDGLEFDGSTVTGTPTQVGLNTLTLTASAKGQAQDLTVTFTVYNVIVDNDDEIIFSNGNSVSSTAIQQTGDDLGVTWAVTSGSLPDGFSLDPATGVVSGSSMTLQEVTVTITGTAANGPAQSITKDITVRSEPTIEITGENSVITYTGAPEKQLQLSATQGTSAVTWSVSSAAGVSIDQSGLLTVTSDAVTGSVTVTVQTAYGGSDTFEVSIVKEDAASIGGGDSLTAKAGESATGAYTCNVTGTWAVNDDNAPVGVTVEISELGVLTISGASPCDAFEVTITLTTEGGQEVQKTVTCQIVSPLIFTSSPMTGLIIVEV